jgi:2-polyprenyl-6-methoxyphenol hydroxylase-like FAD-dependent oxidoreductase
MLLLLGRAMQTQGEAISGSEAVVRTGACIVGGGPAGLMLGLLLAKRGANVVVLEAHRTFDREFRGEVLQPSTARLLDQIGLLPYILEQPHLLLKEGRLLVNGRQKAGFSFDRIAPQYPYAIWMPQPIFLDALARKAVLYPGFQLWMGANVTELVHDGGTVVGVRGLRDGKEPFTIRADVVVGADGRHSMVRKLGNFAIEYEHHDFDMIWFVVDPPPDWSRTIYFAVGTAPLLLLPKYPNQIQVGMVQGVDEWRDWIRKGTEAVRNHVGSLSPLFTKFAAELRDLRPFFPLPGVILMVREWARDGLLLIGDAAHTMSPAGAIGVNVALSTAAVAAQEIFPRLGAGPIQKSALARVQALREEDIRTMHKLQRTAGSTLLGTGSRNPVLRWTVPRLLALAIRVGLFPILQRRLFFGVPLPPLDPAFSFRDATPSAASEASRIAS